MNDRSDSTEEQVPRRGLKGAVSLLRRNADFRNLYGAQLISFGGDWFLQVALLGLVQDLTHSGVLASLVLVAQFVPYVLLSPITGALVDRLNRKHLMIVADVVRTVLCLGYLLVNDAGDVWLVYVLQVLLATFGAIFEPASSAAIPNLVDDDDLPVANTLTGSAWGTMLAIGAALGGLVSVTLGRDAAFLGDAISFGVSGLLLLRIHRAFAESRDESEEHPTILAATVETVRYARREHRVLALLVVKAGFGLGGGVIVLLAVFSHEVFHTGDAGTGVLFAARGVGALIGPFIGRRIAGNSIAGLFLAIGISLGSFGVFYGLFPLMPVLLLAAPFVTGAHLGGGAQWTLSTYGLQVLTPDRIRGRVFAFDFALVTLTIALSNLAAGWGEERFGPEATMHALAVISFCYAVTWWLATRRIRRSSQERGLESESASDSGKPQPVTP